MAIKIKKQGEKPQEPELLDAEGVEPVDELDQFLVTGTQSVHWATEHQNLVLAGIGAVLVIAVAIVFFMEQAKESQIEDARDLVAAVEVLEAPVGDEKPVDLSPPGSTKPKKEGLKYDDYQSKYTALDQKVDGWMSQKPGAQGQVLAQLMKARAAFGLGNYAESSRIYTEWLGAHPDHSARGFVLQALSTSLAAEGKVDEAIKHLDQLKGIDADAYGEWAAWQAGVFYEAAGNKDKAKGAYEALIKDYPDSTRVEQARMRLDLM